MMESLLGFFLVNRPKTSIFYFLSIAIFNFLFLAGIFKIIISYELIDFNALSQSMGIFGASMLICGLAMVALIFSTLVATLDKTIIFSVWYSLFLMESYFLRKHIKINGAELHVLKPHIKMLRKLIEYIFIPLGFISFVFLFTKYFYVYFIILLPFYFFSLLMKKTAYIFVKNKLFVLGITKNQRLEDFNIRELYSEFRELLVSM